MPHTTPEECQTSFQLETSVHFSLQDDQCVTEPNPNLPNENFCTRKPRGRAQKVKQPWDENTSSFSTALKTSSSDAKSTTTSQPYGLLTPRTPSSLTVVGNDAERETDWGTMCRSYSGDGVEYGTLFTPEPYVCLVG
jgi:hypothetical protein